MNMYHRRNEKSQIEILLTPMLECEIVSNTLTRIDNVMF